MKNIPDNHLKEICKIGQRKDCCRYITCGSNGFECAKHTAMKGVLDFKADSKMLTAQSDNCEGLK